MLRAAAVWTLAFYSDTVKRSTPGRASHDRWDKLADSAIFVLGSPRSGTTWLAKIFDSHPDILYRHEPDEASPARELVPAEQVRIWLLQRGIRSAAKRPYFRKSWRPLPLETARRSLAAAVAASGRQNLAARMAHRIRLPDLIPPFRWPAVRATIKLVNWDGAAVARLMPQTRCIFIMRHPCGQIASVMAGLAGKRFLGAQRGMVDMAPAAALAASRGVSESDFAALPDAAKFAWSWLAFNEQAVDSLRSLPNARVVLYEDLCRQPEAVSRALFAFAELPWHPNTTAFLTQSTQDGRGSGYYDVYRATSRIADRWRETMDSRDQDIVRAVIATSPLVRCWPDLAVDSA